MSASLPMPGRSGDPPHMPGGFLLEAVRDWSRGSVAQRCSGQSNGAGTR